MARAPPLPVLLLVLLAAAAAAAPADKAEVGFDHTLSQAGPSCVERFYRLTAQLYPAGSACPETVQQAFAASAQDACPAGGSGFGSPVHACLRASEPAVSSWTAFVSDCPVLKVRERKKGDPTATGGFSCLPTFDSPNDFRDGWLLEGKSVGRVALAQSGAGGARAALAAAAAAVAAAAVGAAVLV